MSDNERRATVERYSSGERTNHWLIALGFVLAALSGLALFSSRPLLAQQSVRRAAPGTRILHPFVGLFMLIVFLPLAASVWGDKPHAGGRLAVAAATAGRSAKTARERLPEVGRYKRRTKSSCSSPSPPACSGCCCPASSSGAPIFSLYFSIGVIRLASVVHAVCAFRVDLRDPAAHLRRDPG